MYALSLSDMTYELRQDLQISMYVNCKLNVLKMYQMNTIKGGKHSRIYLL